METFACILSTYLHRFLTAPIAYLSPSCTKWLWPCRTSHGCRLERQTGLHVHHLNWCRGYHKGLRRDRYILRPPRGIQAEIARIDIILLLLIRDTPIAFAFSFIGQIISNQGPSDDGKGTPMLISCQMGPSNHFRRCHCVDSTVNRTSPLNWLRSCLKIEVKFFWKEFLSQRKKQNKQQTSACFEQFHTTQGFLCW